MTDPMNPDLTAAPHTGGDPAEHPGSTPPTYADIAPPECVECETWYWDERGLTRQQHDPDTGESTIEPDRKLKGPIAMGRVELRKGRGSLRPLVTLSDEQLEAIVASLDDVYPEVEWYYFEDVEALGRKLSDVFA